MPEGGGSWRRPHARILMLAPCFSKPWERLARRCARAQLSRCPRRVQFLSIRDFTEAETCVREMLLDVRQEALVVETALNDSYDLQKETERAAVRDIIARLAEAGCLSGGAIVQGVKVGVPPFPASA